MVDDENNFRFKTIAETIFKMDQTFRNFIEDKMLNESNDLKNIL
jgi:hypothetical protein